ncbi:MAG: hypothetical protein IPN76_04650 [Saprospiraceae bacterium]|nr:hypothetical protein [Saprospiraceae bacterium]
MTFYNDGTPVTYDSILIWHKKAVSHSPQWLLPYFDLAYQYVGTPLEKDETEYWMNSALEIKPNSYKAKEQLSWLYQWQNRTDESLALSDKMILERPELFNAYSTAGVTCMMRKEYERAAAYFKKSLNIEPSPNNWAQYYLVKLLTKTRRQQQAIVMADSIMNNPATTALIRVQGLLYLVHTLFQNEQYELAAELANKLEVGDIGIENAWIAALAKCLNQIKLGNPSEAQVELQKAYVGIIPGYYYDEFHLIKMEAMIAEKEGNYVKSDSLFQAALRIAIPKNTNLVVRTYDLLETLQKEYGCFLLRQKRGAEALAQFQNILSQEPNSWRGYYGMALFHVQKGEKNTALNWLEKSLDYWLPTPELANDEPLFSKIKNTKRFKALMHKHFPSGWEATSEAEK